jgi:hypothetical protein
MPGRWPSGEKGGFAALHLQTVTALAQVASRRLPAGPGTLFAAEVALPHMGTKKGCSKTVSDICAQNETAGSSVLIERLKIQREGR